MRQLPFPPLVYLITEGTLTAANFETNKNNLLSIIGVAAASKIPLVQIREKSLNATQLFQLCTEAVAICREFQTRVIVNDRLDVALSSGAAGVHLPSNGLPAATVRERVPDDFLVGVSGHSIDEVLFARNAGADLVLFSPIFDTPGKGPAVGIDRLRECVVAAGTFPVVALGGIDDSNYADTLAAGAAGFGGIRFLNDSESLVRIGKEFFGLKDE